MFKLFRNTHIYLSLFFLPLALIYAITGVVYIFGFNQDVGAVKNTYQLTQNIEKGKEADALINFLKENKLKIPSNLDAKERKGAISIGGASYSAQIMKNGESNYTITTTQRSFLGNLIMLHKAKGGWYFDVLAVGFGFTLILLYISGLMITLFHSKKNRGLQYATILAGFIITAILGFLSLS
ncbi:MAG: PepSY domain-containing protein [Helicobacter sp.]|nr:PepSY domain-containing protein [Helicobacteraceae bacterium]MDY3112908.1 PepSY domain-containing protein [Helicobacter sp.]